ncbi:dihydroorotase [Serpentinicella sp. ANB-PHB4]|uniref:dihydroorotase n=1 Tax=Serpentinicella sp. ANB-PHB4 TaxID=3074076 RepID=UPI002866C245|nr:dihydroorotase [Serpentinicella sp. ANB-PHB4]MDR5659318.1 dihydroorotase [Serpentinicella sp. ANB-PHB4]
MRILIKNGRIIDPSSKTDEVKDILVENGIIKQVQKGITAAVDEEIDATDHWVVPGLIDVHVHLREPGFEYKETIQTGSYSAAKGGFTTICCMPNTNPPVDNAMIVNQINNKAEKEAVVHVLPVGAITEGQKGEKLVDVEAMVKAGICALSEDGKTVMNTALMKEALRQASKYNIPVLSHCEDHYLVENGGAMNQGERSKELNIKGISADSEEVIVSRDIILAQESNTKLNICHISTKGSTQLVREAKARGEKVWAEVAPHHFTLSDEIVASDNTNTKMNPPLRTKEDVDHIIKGLKDGTIDIIATDHAPHSAEDKDAPYEKAPFGIVGLETSLALGITELVNKKVLTPIELIAKMTINPAKMIGINKGTLSVGEMADITVVDPTLAYEIEVNDFVSKSKNSPFQGKKVQGKARHTLVNGDFVLKDYKLIKGDI